ncbi:hypothetical protein [Dasania marina]|uniref:hypothetical protein n=1 Tax=Dasania marina TaxID=471499 RepID=UPI00036E2D38|nr:hypothetical protein [Dasania marina]
MKFLATIIISIALIGCGTSQTYPGVKLSSDKIATIEASGYNDWGFQTKYEGFAIAQSNELVVGSFTRGYPKEIQVLPGKNKITLLYNTNLGKSFAQQAFSTGLIGGSISNALDKKDHIELEFIAEAGKNYRIMFYPNILSKKETIPQPWVVDINSKEVVFGEVPDIVKDPTIIE